MSRPKLDPTRRKVDAVQIRLTEEERATFNRLRESLAGAEFAGMTISDAAVLRWLFARAAEERGLGNRAKSRATR